MTNETHFPGGGLERVVLRQAQRAPGRRFLSGVHGGHSVTYGQLAQRLRRCRAELDGAAIPLGGRVLVDVADPVDLCVALIGVVAAGRCAVPLDPRAGEAAIAWLALAARPEAAVRACPDSLGAVALDVLPVPSTLDRLPVASRPADTPAPPRGGSLILVDTRSSGATHGVELSEDRLLHVATAVARHNRLTAGDRGMHPEPPHDVDAIVAAVLATLTAGAELVLDVRFHRHGFWESLVALEVSWVNLSGAALTTLAAGDAPVQLPRVRFVRSGSAPLRVELRRRIEGMTGATVVEGLGLLEAAGPITATPLDGSAPNGSCGRPLATDLMVRGRDGQPVLPGAVGTVWVRGAGVIDAVGGEPAADRLDADGWLNTCARGHLDGDGFLFLAGGGERPGERGQTSGERIAAETPVGFVRPAHDHRRRRAGRPGVVPSRAARRAPGVWNGP